MLAKSNPLPYKSVISSNHSWLNGMVLMALLGLGVSAYANDNSQLALDIEIGKKIYEQGLLPSGKPLQGQRLDLTGENSDAPACIKCHRPSGMGSLEGNIVAPPISGKYLFSDKGSSPVALLDIRSPRNVTKPHQPYNDETLTKAIREGININGAKMNPLMPRYSLTDKETQALAAYLKQLSAELSPGVGESNVRFATIITPGMEPTQKQVMIKMMQTAFEQRNASQQSSSGRMRMPLDLLPRVYRKWELSVWELKGSTDTWNSQLQSFYQKEPAFAVISGFSNTTWQPVHDFCKLQRLPCLLPSVVSAPDKNDFYSLYYSQGVNLEAKVLANHLDKNTYKRLIQIFPDNEMGRSVASQLKQDLEASKTPVQDCTFNAANPKPLKKCLKGLGHGDALMLWLSPSEIGKLAKQSGKLSADTIYVSGSLSSSSALAVAKSWKPKLRVIYPYELGKNSQTKINQLKEWLKAWDMPLLNPTLQTEVFFNLLFVTDLTSQILDNYYRDYFLERAEDMLSTGTNSSLYPNLSLAAGQRFASKGAYIARFNDNNELVPDSAWIVP